MRSFLAVTKNISKKAAGRLLFLVRLAIGTALIIFLIDYLDYTTIKKALVHSNKMLLLISLMMSLVNITLVYFRWKFLCNRFLHLKDTKLVRKSLFVGYASGIWTPIRIGEYFGRSFSIKEKSFSQIVIVTAIEKLFPLFVTILVGGAASIIFINKYYQVSALITIALFTVLFILGFIFIILLNSREFWKNFVLAKLKKVKFLQKFISDISILRSLDNSIAFYVFLFSILIYLNYTFQMALLIGAFSLHYSIITFFLVSNVVMFTKAFVGPITMGELGIRESASVYFVGLVGIAGEAGFNASLFLFILNLVIPSLIGLFYLMKRNYA